MQRGTCTEWIHHRMHSLHHGTLPLLPLLRELFCSQASMLPCNINRASVPFRHSSNRSGRTGTEYVDCSVSNPEKRAKSPSAALVHTKESPKGYNTLTRRFRVLPSTNTEAPTASALVERPARRAKRRSKIVEAPPVAFWTRIYHPKHQIPQTRVLAASNGSVWKSPPSIFPSPATAGAAGRLCR